MIALSVDGESPDSRTHASSASDATGPAAEGPDQLGTSRAGASGTTPPEGSPWLTPPPAEPAEPDDVTRVAEVLGRRPDAPFTVAARAPGGEPTVILNAPFLGDGTPMPTRWWLVDPGLRTRIGTLESEGGVRAAEAAVDPGQLQRAHDTYAALRDAAIEADHAGPRPSGGVGGTRRGVKCLHAHYAWFLAGGHDPVGAWVHQRLEVAGADISDRDAHDA